LTDLLGNRDQHVAVAAAWAIVQISQPSSEVAAKTLTVLVAGLGSSRPEVRQGAAESLGRLGRFAERAVPALQRLSSDSDEAVRRSSAVAVRSIRSGSARRE
jgi:HEAT repeat protein